MADTPLNSARVRYLLGELLRTSPAFEAFLQDFFATVARNKTSSMSRTDLENLLFSSVSLEEIAAALEAAEPERYRNAVDGTSRDASQGPEPLRATKLFAPVPVTSSPPRAKSGIAVTELNRPQIRALLTAIFCTERAMSEFIAAFCPLAYREFSSSMGRTQRETILLQHATTEDIFMALRERFPAQVQAFLLRLP